MKFNHKLNKPKKMLARAKVYYFALYTKRPTLTILGSLALFIALCGTSYGTYQYVQQAQHATRNTEIKSIKRLDETTGKIAADSKLNTQDSTNTKNDTKSASEEPDPRTPTSKTGAGCAGVACYSSGNFSLVMGSTVTIQAGKTYGPFYAKTSDGSKVRWNTPSAGDSSGVHTYTNDSLAKLESSSSQNFYIRAEEYTKPGKYYLTFDVFKDKNKTSAKATVAVTVTARKYFTINTSSTAYSVTRSNEIVEIPYTITRYNKHGLSVEVSATIDKAPAQHYIRTINVVKLTENTGKIIFNGSNGGVPSGTYILSVYAQDEAGGTAHDSFKVTVNWN